MKIGRRFAHWVSRPVLRSEYAEGMLGSFEAGVYLVDNAERYLQPRQPNSAAQAKHAATESEYSCDSINNASKRRFQVRGRMVVARYAQ